uniref:Uncharacterized protein n=1 Tax=Helianthus annuus TaxID=4232 RepID=A0A251VIN7_HELAN
MGYDQNRSFGILGTTLGFFFYGDSRGRQSRGFRRRFFCRRLSGDIQQRFRHNSDSGTAAIPAQQRLRHSSDSFVDWIDSRWKMII